jgi:hypothetical protein
MHDSESTRRTTPRQRPATALSPTQLATYEALRVQVAQWSRVNFGNQYSHHRQVDICEDAPLLGMFEEAGEYLVAPTSEERLDALADIMIFLADWLGRSGYTLHRLLLPTQSLPWNLTPHQLMVVGISQLAHATLKRHQGIRGFNDPHKFEQEAGAGVGALLVGVLEAADTLGHPCPVRLAVGVFEAIVGKRVWANGTSNGGSV